MPLGRQRSIGANRGNEAIHERALARTRRTGDADDIGPAGPTENRSHQFGARRILVLDERNAAGDCPPVARQNAVGERAHRERSSRAITSRWISLVPSPIVVSLTSRKYFSAG